MEYTLNFQPLNASSATEYLRPATAPVLRYGMGLRRGLKPQTLSAHSLSVH